MRTRTGRIATGVLALALIGGLVSTPLASAAPVVRNPGDPAYRYQLSTGGLGHVWTGTGAISFTNVDASPLSTLYLRLWSNGVSGCSGQDAIELTNLQGGTASEALDCTELKVVLDAPVASGDRGTLAFDLRIEVPNRNDRFGYHRGLALMGTALPTLEVHDDLGWHHDPFIDLGESFYSIVGRYRVTLDTPASLDTPATGVVASRSAPAPGRVRTTYVARDVRDFAWAAGHLDKVTGSSHGTRIVVSYRPDDLTRRRAKKALADAERSMDTFSKAFGRFPYPEMDVVLAAFSSFGGMEYPTVIFTNPDRYTVSHELAHQWWYGIVGDDEFAEPWLDESFATWSSALPFDEWVGCGSYHFSRDDERISNDMDYWNLHPNRYGVIYSGGGCMLANLAKRFGPGRFTGILRRYADRSWLGVSRTAVFQRAIERAAAKALPGLDMDRYWRTWRIGPAVP